MSRPSGITTLTCECGSEVSGPDPKSVQEHMDRHKKKAHPPKPREKPQRKK